MDKQNELIRKHKLFATEKEEIENILAAAIPLVKEAKTSVSNLEKSQLNEIVANETPSESVQSICECLLIIKGFKDISWKGVRAAVEEEDFVHNLIDINCDLITYKQIQQCKNTLKVRSY